MTDAKPSPAGPPGAPNIGIDLGTSTCAVARLVDDRDVVCCEIEGPGAVMPSTLFFGDEVHAGEDALSRGLAAPEGFVESFKQEMGAPNYSRKIHGHWIPPEVLSAFLLDDLRRRTESQIGPVGGAVITVPAYFDERRRRATLEAGRLAGLNVLDIINEPVAAALASLHHRGRLGPRFSESFKTLVYDLGGGTFDVSVLEVQGPEITTLSADGDIRLGGRDFDDQIVEFVAGRFEEHHGIDPRIDFGYAQQLWRLAREAKHTLSQQESATVVCAFADMRLAVELTRADFEGMLQPYLERTMFTAGDALRQAGLRWSDLDEVLLVGGSSRIPVIAQRIAAETGVTPTPCHDPDLVVAQGAALYASLSSSRRYEPIRLVNVNAHSLGISGVDADTNRAVNRIMIPRNSRLPASKRTKFVTKAADQKSIQIKIIEGDHEDPRFCVPVGTCVVTLTPGLPARTEAIVTMQVGSNGTLSVSCRIPLTQDAAHAEIRRDGLTDLESLPVWRDRLLRGVLRSEEALPTLPAAPTVESPERFDHNLVVQRIDCLCQELGEKLAEATVPPAALPAQRQLAAALREYLTTRALLETVRHKLATAGDPLERRKLQSAAATVKSYLTEAQKLLVYSRIAFGGGCVAQSIAPEPLRPIASEVETLYAAVQAWLDEDYAAADEIRPA